MCLYVKLKDGQWTMDDGSPLPKIREGTVAELVLSAYAIMDEDVLKGLTEEREVPFLSAGTPLWARVAYREVANTELCKSVEFLSCWPPRNGSVFVKILLKEDLRLTLHPNKNARLTDCACSIPSMEVEAKSVNQACALVSAKFEPQRRSHTGSVFQNVYYEGKYIDRDYLLPLNERRKAVETASAPGQSCGGENGKRENLY